MPAWKGTSICAAKDCRVIRTVDAESKPGSWSQKDLKSAALLRSVPPNITQSPLQSRIRLALAESHLETLLKSIRQTKKEIIRNRHLILEMASLPLSCQFLGSLLRASCTASVTKATGPLDALRISTPADLRAPTPWITNDHHFP